MPLPTADCPQAVLDDYCCEDLPAMANRIRSVAFDAILDCVDPICSDREMRSYVSHGPRIQEPLGDALTVHLVDLTPNFGAQTPVGNLYPIGVYRVTFEVWLVENGWPMPEVIEDSQQIVMPDSEIVHGAALHAMAHAMRMYRDLAEHIQKRTLFTATLHPHVGKVGLGPLRPTQPTSFQAGYSCTVSADVTLGSR